MIDPEQLQTDLRLAENTDAYVSNFRYAVDAGYCQVDVDKFKTFDEDDKEQLSIAIEESDFVLGALLTRDYKSMTVFAKSVNPDGFVCEKITDHIGQSTVFYLSSKDNQSS
jgi:hypothetical protein